MNALPPGTVVMLYDGVCGLCHGLVQFLLRRDAHDRLRFAPLQSTFAIGILHRHGIDAADLNTVYAVLHCGEPTEALASHSNAVLTVLTRLGGSYRAARLLFWIPRPLRDVVYRLVARTRYRIFGRLDACAVPTPAQRAKFLSY